MLSSKALDVSREADVYVQFNPFIFATLEREKLGQQGKVRGKAQEVTSVVAFAADVDFAGA